MAGSSHPPTEFSDPSSVRDVDGVSLPARKQDPAYTVSSTDNPSVSDRYNMSLSDTFSSYCYRGTRFRAGE